MTSTIKLALCVGIFISLLSGSVYAQSAGTESTHFASDVISFDYPAGFSVTDESTKEEQRLIITRKGSSVQLTIVALRRMTLQDEFSAAVPTFTEPLVKKVVTTLGQDKNPPERISFQTQVGPKQAEGVRLRTTGGRKRTGEVIWLRLSLRLIGLAFIRADADESVGSQLWQTVSSSLRVEAPVVGTRRVEPTESAASVAAARAAKFRPTFLEDEPVKVVGVIKYNFVAR